MKRSFLAAVALLVALLTAVSLTGCGVSIGVREPTPTVSQSAEAGMPTSSVSAIPSATSSVTASGTAEPTAEPTAASWKTFTDAAKSVSFELPADWSAQVATGTAASALKVEVRDSAGTIVATLATHMSGLGGACQSATMRPYMVLASIPMNVPSTNTASTAVDPRFVYRLIQGSTHYYASYGITDSAGGKDGKACLIYNTVNSEKLGIYMFGDVLQFTSALDGTPGLRAFATITEAQAYMLSSEYQNIQRMITSLKSLG